MPPWIVLLPPLLVVLTAIFTRRMVLAFMTGIISSALIAYNGDIYTGFHVVISRLWTNTGLAQASSWHGLCTSWNLLIFTFLISLGTLIALLQRTGATSAYVRFVQHVVKGPRSVEITSLLLSLLFFIDDYFSALTVGSVMRHVARLYKVPAVKIAFLTTAMASPLAMLSPLSSWIGEILLQLRNIGINTSLDALIAADPYTVFLHTIPTMIYPILLIGSAWYIVLRRISYGPMATYEAASHAQQDTNFSLPPASASFFDFFIPLGSLLGGILGQLLFSGNFFLFGGNSSFIEAIKTGSVPQALCLGGFVALFVSSILFFTKKRLTGIMLWSCIIEGCQLMLPSILMLLCAWTLGSFLKQDLKTGNYIATMFASIITATSLPALCFLCASITAWLIGSAWATMGLMLPIVMEMLQNLLHLPVHSSLESVSLLIPVLGATLSGSVMGTHVSLISDNPIMSAASSGADHVAHIKTMMWYILPIAASTTIAYTIVGILLQTYSLGTSLMCAITCGMLITICFFEAAQKIFGK